MTDHLVDLRGTVPNVRTVMDLRTYETPPPPGTTPLDAPYVMTVALVGSSANRADYDTVTLAAFDRETIVRLAQAILGATTTDAIPVPQAS